MPSPFLQIEDYITGRFATLTGQIEDLTRRLAAVESLPAQTAHIVPVVPLPAHETTPAAPTATPRRTRGPNKPKAAPTCAGQDVTTSAPQAPVQEQEPTPTPEQDAAAVAAAQASILDACKPAPATTEVTKIVTLGDLIAAVQAYRAKHGIEAARALWAKIAPNHAKISGVPEAERASILAAVEAANV